MCKKTTSNRKSEAVWTAFYSEFGDYVEGSVGRFKRMLEAWPRTVFVVMVTSIVVSIGCFLFLPKRAPKKSPAPQSMQQPFMDGMGGVLTTVSALKELLELRTLLDDLMGKENLDSADSLLMERAITRMQILEERLAEADKHHISP